MLSPLVQQLIEKLRYLPGVGPKSAQRMAFQLLARGRKQGLALAEALTDALINVTHCVRCRNFAEASLCPLCDNPTRNTDLLCIVETPSDVLALEQTASYNGLYFVLMGHLSPLDGIGPEQIGLPLLNQRILEQTPKEVILATNPTMEGEATAHYITQQMHRHNIACSRIAHGVPLDGELGYLDLGTLARALTDRTAIV